MGVRGHALKWFTSYLSGRKQYTTVSNIDSQLKDISYGVPQGSRINHDLKNILE